MSVGGKTYDVELLLTDLIGTNNSGSYPIIGIREALEILRDNLVFTIDSVTVAGTPFTSVSQALGLFSVVVAKVLLLHLLILILRKMVFRLILLVSGLISLLLLTIIVMITLMFFILLNFIVNIFVVCL